jgi:hypothetical protein
MSVNNHFLVSIIMTTITLVVVVVVAVQFDSHCVAID